MSVFNPITNKKVKVGSNVYKCLTADTIFTHDLQNNILIPNVKTNYNWNTRLKRWLHKNYVKPTPKPRVKKPVLTTERPAIRVSLNVEGNPYSDELKDALRRLGQMKIQEVGNPVKVKPQKIYMSIDTPILTSSKLRPTKANKFKSELNVLKSGPKLNAKYMKVFKEIVDTRAYNRIVDTLDDFQNKLYWDYDDKKEIGYSHAGNEKLSRLFKTFEDVVNKPTGQNLDNAIKAFNTIFNTLQFDKKLVKKIEDASTVDLFIKDMDDILSEVGRNPFR